MLVHFKCTSYYYWLFVIICIANLFWNFLHLGRQNLRYSVIRSTQYVMFILFILNMCILLGNLQDPYWYRSVSLLAKSDIPTGYSVGMSDFANSDTDWYTKPTDIDQCHCWRNLAYQQSTLLVCTRPYMKSGIPTEYSVGMSDFANSDTDRYQYVQDPICVRFCKSTYDAHIGSRAVQFWRNY